MTKNLYKETLEMLDTYDYDPNSDIRMIGNGEYFCTWAEFIKLANKEYNERTMVYKVAYDLTIVFKDGTWIERYHDGGGERWIYHKCPQAKKGTKKKIKNLFGHDNSLSVLCMK